MFFGEGGKLILEAILELLELFLELGTHSHFLLFSISHISYIYPADTASNSLELAHLGAFCVCFWLSV